MGDGREHLRAVLQEVLELGLHGVEREDRLADFVGADDRNRRRLVVDAKAPRTFGKAFQRCGQVPGGDQRDDKRREQDQRDDDQVARPFAQPPTARWHGENHPGMVGQFDDHRVARIRLVGWPVGRFVGFDPGVRSAQLLAQERRAFAEFRVIDHR